VTHGCLSTKNILKTSEQTEGDLCCVMSHKQLRLPWVHIIAETDGGGLEGLRLSY
jgi:hypothetical protein